MIDRVIFNAAAKVGENRTQLIEEMIELHLRPKPKWLPKSIWLLAIKHLLVIVSKEGE